MKNIKNKLISFDIFDTIISRQVVTPDAIFKLMQDRLCCSQEFVSFSNVLKNNFFEIRKSAEKYVSENLRINDDRLANFDDIYNFISTNYNLTQDQCMELKELEITIEKSNIIPIYKNINKLKQFYDSGATVILISDMYFSSQIIRDFLLPFGEIFNHIKIYVSSECNATKRNGSLYKLIKQNYTDFSEWIHYGDNWFSDILMAMRNGIKAKQYKLPSLQKHEKFLLKKCNYDNKINLITGISRKLILNRTENDIKYIFGASFAGPILYNYAKWVIEQSLSRKINHIYFVARDGYIIKKIVDRILESFDLPLVTHYFYSSRLAARIISDLNYDDFIDCIFREKYTNKSIHKLLSILNISIDDLSQYTNKSTKELSKIKIDYLKTILINNIDLKEFILERNKEKNTTFRKYIEQEIPQTERKVAFVDINGSGRTQDFLSQILYKKNGCICYNFYFHNTLAMQQKEYSIKSSYFSSPDFVSCWIEFLCRSLQGQTIGYQNNSKTNIIEPILESEINPHLLNWGFEKYLQGILDYTYEALLCEQKNKVNINNYKFYLCMYEYIQKYLDKDFADCIGSIPFSDFGREKHCKEVASKVNIFNILIPHSFDYISIARCNSVIKPIIKFIKKVIAPTTYGYINKDFKKAYLKVFNFKLDISWLIWRE